MCVVFPSILLTSTVLSMVNTRFCGRERYGGLKMFAASPAALCNDHVRYMKCPPAKQTVLDDKGIIKWLNNGWLG